MKKLHGIVIIIIFVKFFLNINMSTKTKTIDLSRMTNHAHFQFIKQLTSMLSETGASALKIDALLDVLIACHGQEALCMKVIEKNEHTASIAALDKRRDTVFSGIRTIVTIALNHENPDVCEAAEGLKMLMDTYGKIAKLPLNKQTSATYNLLQELNGKYAANCAITGLDIWRDDLETLNNTIDQLVRERMGMDERMEKPTFTMRQARAQTNKAYSALAERINALAVVDNAPIYEETIRKINLIITQYTEK